MGRDPWGCAEIRVVPPTLPLLSIPCSLTGREALPGQEHDIRVLLAQVTSHGGNGWNQLYASRSGRTWQTRWGVEHRGEARKASEAPDRQYLRYQHNTTLQSCLGVGIGNRALCQVSLGTENQCHVSAAGKQRRGSENPDGSPGERSMVNQHNAWDSDNRLCPSSL